MPRPHPRSWEGDERAGQSPAPGMPAKPRNTHPGSGGPSCPVQGALGLQVERTYWVGKGQKPGLKAQK